jgi:perosamine synthetase
MTGWRRDEERSAMTTIPPFRLTIDAEEEAAVLGVLRSGQVAAGADIERFERALGEMIGVGHVAALSSGFASLHLALLALGIKAGDDVILPAVSTCAAMRDAIHAAGAVPVFADTNRTDFNLDPEAVRRKIGTRTRAIIAPHHTGIPCRIEELNALGLPVIEDCAQALGATVGGKPVGSLSAVSVFSFYATKLATTVDGGAVASDRTGIVERVRDLRYYGGCSDAQPRFNYKMQNLGAALGRIQLRKLAAANGRRRSIADTYRTAWSQGGGEPDALLQRDPASVDFKFALRVLAEKRDEFREQFVQRGIPCRPEVDFYAPDPEAYPAARQLRAEVLTLPTYPALTDDEVRHIAASLTDVLRGARYTPAADA